MSAARDFRERDGPCRVGVCVPRAVERHHNIRRRRSGGVFSENSEIAGFHEFYRRGAYIVFVFAAFYGDGQFALQNGRAVNDTGGYYILGRRKISEREFTFQRVNGRKDSAVIVLFSEFDRGVIDEISSRGAQRGLRFRRRHGGGFSIRDIPGYEGFGIDGRRRRIHRIGIIYYASDSPAACAQEK